MARIFEGSRAQAFWSLGSRAEPSPRALSDNEKQPAVLLYPKRSQTAYKILRSPRQRSIFMLSETVSDRAKQRAACHRRILLRVQVVAATEPERNNVQSTRPVAAVALR